MKATSRPSSGYTQQIEVRQHGLVADEPPDLGGADQGPTPQELLAASLAACTTITLQMYAERKEWTIDSLEVEVSYDQPERDKPTVFAVVLRLPANLDDEQVERLRAIASRCPVHRVLAGEASFEDRVERV